MARESTMNLANCLEGMYLNISNTNSFGNDMGFIGFDFVDFIFFKDVRKKIK